ARDPLKDAFRVFDALGARTWAERANDEFNATVPRQTNVTGRGTGEELTTTERTVIRHHLEGSSNKVIGHKLGVSEKTIEGHNTKIFRKLGVNSRFELVKQVREEPELLED